MNKVMSKLGRRIELVYCDDIRQELGSKFSYMGVYGSDLVLQSLPATLPKLCIAVKLVTDAAHPFEDLEVLLLRGNEREVILETGPLSLPAQEIHSEGGSEVIVVQTFLVLSPFQVDKETTLHVKAKTGSEDLMGLDFRIKTAA